MNNIPPPNLTPLAPYLHRTAMSISPDLHSRIQRGPPNMFNLPDMFREIAHSLRRYFRRVRTRHRQSMCRILFVARCHIESLLMLLGGKQTNRPEEQGGPASLYYIQPGEPSSGSGESRLRCRELMSSQAYFKDLQRPSIPAGTISYCYHIRLPLIVLDATTNPSSADNCVASFIRFLPHVLCSI